MWMWLCVEKIDLFRIWRHSWKEEDKKKYCEAEKDTKRKLLIPILMAVNCFRDTKQRAGEKCDVIGVNFRKDESDIVKVGGEGCEGLILLFNVLE